jgi:hypothetical protein
MNLNENKIENLKELEDILKMTGLNNLEKLEILLVHNKVKDAASL